MKIAIDPGHGGTNRGAVLGPFVEKSWTMHEAWRVKRFLDDEGVVATLTRNGDETVGLWERATKARGSDVVVSIHLNNYKRDQHRRGALVFYLPDDPASQVYAESIARLWPEELMPCRSEPAGRGYERVQNVLEPHDCPAVLVECGFISNSRDATVLATTTGQYAIAQAIAHGLVGVCAQSEHPSLSMYALFADEGPGDIT